jgi:hypothetical protein
MSDLDAWIYLDGPEPEELRPLLDAAREVPDATPEEREEDERALLAMLDARASRRAASGAESEERRDGGPATAGGEAGAAVGAAAHAESMPRAESAPRAGGGGPTARSPVVEARGDAAALTAGAGAAVIEVLGGAAEGASAAVPEGPKSTAMALDLTPEMREQLGRLPFRPVAPGEPPPWQGVGKTMQVPVYGRAPGMTAPLGDEAIAKAVAAAALPFVGSAAGTGFPRLSLEQYASLRAELAVAPGEAAEIMRRYQVPDEAAWRALQGHWEKVFAARPEERASFERAVGEFVAWLRAARR